MSYSNTHRARQGPGDDTSTDSLSDIVDQVRDLASAECLSLHDVLETIGDASFGPILLLPALAVATPLSGIPLFSSLMGIVILLVALQMLLRRQHLWLPDWVLQRQVKGQVVHKAFGYLRPVAAWSDAHTHHRAQWLLRPPFVVVPQLLCVLSGVMMPMLEVVPFSSSALGTGVALLALGMMTRDGLVLALGVIPYGIVGWLTVTTLA